MLVSLTESLGTVLIKLIIYVCWVAEQENGGLLTDILAGTLFFLKNYLILDYFLMFGLSSF